MRLAKLVKTTRLLVILIVILGCVGCDQVTKSAARAHLVPGQTVSLARDTIRLEYAENPGAFLSLGDSLPASARIALFDLGGLALVAAAIIWALTSKRSTTGQILGTALMCGGGIGNLIDRFTHGGYVVDFLNVGIGPIRTGIFNIADFAVLAGAVVVAASWMLSSDSYKTPGS